MQEQIFNFPEVWGWQPYLNSKVAIHHLKKQDLSSYEVGNPTSTPRVLVSVFSSALLLLLLEHRDCYQYYRNAILGQ
jgi:hypothetical protein